MNQGALSDEQLAEFAKETSAPVPTEFGANTSHFERWISAGLVPIAGLNLYLVGCLRLGRLAGSVREAAFAALAVGAAALVAAFPRARVPSYADFCGVGVAGLFLGGVLLAPSAAIALALAAVALLFWGVGSGRVHGRAFALLSLWVTALLDGRVSNPKLVVAGVLAPVAVLLVRRSFLGAAFVVIGVVLGSGAIELADQGGGQVMVMAICGVGCAIAILYEIAVPIREFSSLRLLVGQAPVVLGLGLAAWSVLPKSTSARFSVVALASAVAAYQLVRLYKEAANVPARFAWVGLAAAAAVLAELDLVSTIAVAGQVVVVAALLHVAAIAFESGVLADTGVVLLFGVLASLVIREQSVSLSVVSIGSATGAALVIASARFPATAPLPWWSGFVRESHANLIGDGIRAVVKRLGQLTLVKLFFGWLSVVVIWLRFAVSAGDKSDIRPYVNLAGHALLSLFVSQKLVAWLCRNANVQNAGAEFVFTTFATVAYGVLLVARGVGTKRFFSRLLGVVIVLVPGARAIFTSTLSVSDFAWLLLATGIGLAVAGFLVKQIPDLDLDAPASKAPTGIEDMLEKTG